ncbi:MAG: response regulator [Calditrichaeota bacterium]|nr:response regulator [Calditrichota bacterium]
MGKDVTNIKLLLVDDEDDFRRATSKTLVRRGFTVSEAATGEDALISIKQELPDIVLLDLKMPGLDGIETLQRIRQKEKTLPVIILTGHGDFRDALAGIRLEIVDFIQKPVDVDQLSDSIHLLLTRGIKPLMRERSISELMKPPSLYPKLYVDEPVTKALEALRTAFFELESDDKKEGKVRSALVYDRDEKFLGLIRFPDLLRLVMPPFLNEPYTTFFTGMFLAQCKLISKRNIKDLMPKQIFIKLQAPLMEAIYLMIEHKLINLPVMMDDELVGILRERDIILEIANNLV